jgi:hypothetical protein
LEERSAHGEKLGRGTNKRRVPIKELHRPTAPVVVEDGEERCGFPVESPQCAVSLVAGVGALCGAATEPYLRLTFIRVRRNQETVEERVEGNPSLRWHQAANMLDLAGVK